MKALVNIDENDLALAAALLGTSNRRETISAALRVVADRQRLVARSHQDCLAIGVGADITDPIVMARARR